MAQASKFEFIDYANLKIGKVSLNREQRSRARVAVMLDYKRKVGQPERKSPNEASQPTMKKQINKFRIATPRVNDRKRSEDSSKAAATIRSPGQFTSPRMTAVINYPAFDIDTSRPETRALIQYYLQSYWTNSAAVNPDGEWKSLVFADPAMVHATLSLMALHRSDSQGGKPGFEHLQHRGEAIQIVAQRLPAESEAMSDGSLGAIALLASLDDHSQDTQDAHMTALVSLVQKRGGIDSKQIGDTLRRVLRWVDLLHSALHETEPQFGQVQKEITKTENLSHTSTRMEFEYENAQHDREVTTMKPLHNILQLLYNLRDLKTKIGSDTESTRRRLFSDTLWKLEYDLMNLDKLIISHRIWGQIQALRAFRDAALIYSYSYLRLQNSILIFGRLKERLRGYIRPILDQLRTNPTYLDHTDASLLVWILEMGWRSAALAREDGRWFAHRAMEVASHYNPKG